MSRDKTVLRFYDLLFLIGAAIFFCSLALGIEYSLRSRSEFPSVYQSYLAQADLAFSKKDFGIAAERYRIASELNREDPIPLFKLGLCLEVTRQKELAKAAYERGIKLQLASANTYKPQRAKKFQKKQKK